MVQARSRPRDGCARIRDHWQQQFPGPVRGCTERAPRHLRRLEQLAADEPSQRLRAQDLVAAIRDYLAYNAEPVLRFSGEVGGRGAARAAIRRRRKAPYRRHPRAVRRISWGRRTSLSNPERVPPTRARGSRLRSGSAASRLRLGSSSSLPSTSPARSHGLSGKPPRRGAAFRWGPFHASPRGRTGRGRRPDAGIQRDGRAPPGRAGRSRGAERAAARQRPHEVGARKHGFARAETPLAEHPRVHFVAPLEGLRPGDAPALSRRG